jgi:hypothetical protein
MIALNNDALAALRQTLPPAVPEDELILRPDRESPTATLRREGAPPQIFAWRDARWCALQAREDEGLRGASLIDDAEACAAHCRPVTGELETVQLVAWRPGRRAVLRLKTRAGAVYWLKLLDRKSYRRAAAVFSAVGAPAGGIRLVTPVLMLPELGGYLAPSAEGVSVRSLLARGEAVSPTWLAEAVKMLGRTPVAGELPVLEFAEARAATVGMLAKAASMEGPWGEFANTLGRITSPQVNPALRGLVHGDLHDKQIFVSATGVSLIDLEGISIGDTRFDAVNLAEQLRLRDLQQYREDRGGADRLLAALGHERGAREIVAYQAVIRARLAAVYALRPRWSSMVGRLIEEVRGLIAQAG